MEPLYIPSVVPEVDFIKVGAEARLSDNADTWVQEVSKELHKQHPYVGTFDVSAVMTETDGEKGYGIGYFEVSSKTARGAFGPGGEAMRAMSGIRTVRIPIIIKENKLTPLDVFMDADKKARPLTETRLRVAMYRPQMFDTAAKSPGDASLSETLYPPSARQRSLYGGQVTEAPQTKISSAKPQFLLEAIGPSILASDLARIDTEMEKDASLTRALLSNEGTLPILQFLDGLEPIEIGELSKLASTSVPDVYQVVREGETYLLKIASSQQFSPEVVEADRPGMSELAGEDMVEAADRFGASTVSTDPVVHSKLEDEEISVIERFGEYRVKTQEGKEIMGWVFPTVLDYSGVALPMSMFTNGSESAIQEQIAGSFVGKSPNVIKADPEGYGFFYRVTQSGSVIAFVPTEIKTKAQDEMGQFLVGETVMGEPIKVRFAQHLNELTQIGEGEVALPTDIRWAPLGEKVNSLISEPEQFVKISHILKRAEQVQIISDKSTWTFRGGAGLSKLAHQYREGLEGSDAVFMACVLGMEPQFAINQLIKAAQRGSVVVDGCREVHIPQEKLAAARSEAKTLLDSMPPRYLLLKEAAALEDITTVDKVLSINFLTPENIQTFIDYLPDFEEAISKLASLLITVRLGMQDVPESSVKNSMERLDEVVDGLKEAVFRNK
jgi:hypothetical protein